MTQHIDDNLLDKIKISDYSAFRKVFDQYFKSLVIRSYQIVREEQLAKDAVQEVFLALWKNRTKLPENIKLEPYLRRSTINRSLNIIKSRSHHIGAGQTPLTTLKEKNLQPDEQSEFNELRDVIQSTIDQLPERCKQIYMLCKQDGMTHKEVAEILDISTKTIENQITKALKTLRTAVRTYQSHTVSFVLLVILWGIFTFQLLYV